MLPNLPRIKPTRDVQIMGLRLVGDVLKNLKKSVEDMAVNIQNLIDTGLLDNDVEEAYLAMIHGFDHLEDIDGKIDACGLTSYANAVSDGLGDACIEDILTHQEYLWEERERRDAD